jgi:hypothetical protein
MAIAQRVTVIVDDDLIVVDGVGRIAKNLRELPLAKELHAVQWYGDRGEIENVSAAIPNERLSLDDYKAKIAPWVKLHSTLSA